MLRRVGIISDTHVPHFNRLPEAIWIHFTDVETIIHAGDLSVLSVLAELEAIAPVVAVQGNVEHEEVVLKLPIKREIVVGWCKIGIVHILLQYPQKSGSKKALDQSSPLTSTPGKVYTEETKKARKIITREVSPYDKSAQKEFPDARVVVFGHSHVPYNQEHNGQLLFNPGSANDRRRQPTCSIGMLSIDDEARTVRGEIISI